MIRSDLRGALLVKPTAFFAALTNVLQEGRDLVRLYPDTEIVLTDKQAAVLRRKSAVHNGRFDDTQGCTTAMIV